MSRASPHVGSGTSTPRGGPSAPIAAAARPIRAAHSREKAVAKDGGEAYFLKPSATNFLLLSLKSTLPSHIDWALARFLHASFRYPERLTLEFWPGLVDALLTFPLRLVAALKGEPEKRWAPRFFETAEPRTADEALGYPVPPAEPAAKRQRVEAPSAAYVAASETHGAPSRLGAVVSGTDDAEEQAASLFRPAHEPTHADLARRALTASLILRNLSIHSKNSKQLYGARDILPLIADILTVPALGNADEDDDDEAGEDDAWAELEAVREMRATWIDICEGIAHRLVLSKRGGAEEEEEEEEEEEDNDVPSAAMLASDAIYERLVAIVLRSQDRQLLLSSLRVLGVMAENERNESAFIELEAPGYPTAGSTSYPGLARRCAELLPLSEDAGLIEPVMDCFYQVLRISNNALRLVSSGVRLSASTPHSRDIDGLIRFLLGLLTHRRVVWPRSTPVVSHPLLHDYVPTLRKHEDLQQRPDERERKRRANRWLTKAELMRLAQMEEPQRLLAWMETVYELKPRSEVTQMEVWTTYRDQFSELIKVGAPPLQPAAEVIRQVSIVFPGASALVQPGQRFVISGIDLKDREVLRRYQCKWRECSERDCSTRSELLVHLSQHLPPSTEPQQCKWLSCTYALPLSVPEAQRTRALLGHILTHIPDDADQKAGAQAQPAKADAAPVRVTTDASGQRRLGDALVPDAIARAQKAERATGTVDNPAPVSFRVTRTPMDAESRPMGVAGTAALILRSLARTSARVLDRAEGGGERSVETTTTQAPSSDDRFGLPLPLSGRMDMRGATARLGADDLAALISSGPAEEASSGPTEWEVDAARKLMDALIGVEDELVMFAAENDILCSILNDTMMEFRTDTRGSILPVSEDGEDGLW